VKVRRLHVEPLNNGLLLAVRSASLRSAQRPSAEAATVGQAKPECHGLL
jgi:hypothetical protein